MGNTCLMDAVLSHELVPAGCRRVIRARVVSTLRTTLRRGVLDSCPALQEWAMLRGTTPWSAGRSLRSCKGFGKSLMLRPAWVVRTSNERHNQGDAQFAGASRRFGQPGPGPPLQSRRIRYSDRIELGRSRLLPHCARLARSRCLAPSPHRVGTH